MADDETRFEGVATLGVDEHVWHHVSTKPIDQGGRGHYPPIRAFLIAFGPSTSGASQVSQR